MVVYTHEEFMKKFVKDKDGAILAKITHIDGKKIKKEKKK